MSASSPPRSSLHFGSRSVKGGLQLGAYVCLELLLRSFWLNAGLEGPRGSGGSLLEDLGTQALTSSWQAQIAVFAVRDVRDTQSG